MRFQDTDDFPSIRGPMTSTAEAPPSPYRPAGDVANQTPRPVYRKKQMSAMWYAVSRAARHPVVAVNSLRAR